MNKKEKNPNQIITRCDLQTIFSVSEKTARLRYKEFLELLDKPMNKPYANTILNKDLLELGFEMI